MWISKYTVISFSSPNVIWDFAETLVDIEMISLLLHGWLCVRGVACLFAHRATKYHQRCMLTLMLEPGINWCTRRCLLVISSPKTSVQTWGPDLLSQEIGCKSWISQMGMSSSAPDQASSSVTLSHFSSPSQKSTGSKCLFLQLSKITIPCFHLVFSALICPALKHHNNSN